MDSAAQKVSNFVCDVKKAILPRFYNNLQSTSGHSCMKKTGPIIAFCFYSSQVLHAFLFLTVFGPAIHEKLVDYPGAAYVVQFFGWFLCFKVTYLYYRVSTSSPGVPSEVYNQKNYQKSAKQLKKSDSSDLLALDKDLETRYSQDMAQILRYTSLIENDFDTFQNTISQLPETENVFCRKCNFIKPLRTHHCSVCNKCVLIMDHHCMWTNNCIGINNYKQFIQLCGFGQFAAFFTVFVILACEKETFVATSEWKNFFYFCRMWDLLIGKVMMAFFGWNCYVAFSGLSYLEYKNLLETRAKMINLKENGVLVPTGVKNQDDKKRVLLKFNYGFSSRHENIVRVLKTDNYILGFLFTDWFEDERLNFNGSEWTSFYYYHEICKVSGGAYQKEEYVQNLDEQTVNST